MKEVLQKPFQLTDLRQIWKQARPKDGELRRLYLAFGKRVLQVLNFKSATNHVRYFVLGKEEGIDQAKGILPDPELAVEKLDDLDETMIESIFYHVCRFWKVDPERGEEVFPALLGDLKGLSRDSLGLLDDTLKNWSSTWGNLNVEVDELKARVERLKGHSRNLALRIKKLKEGPF